MYEMIILSGRRSHATVLIQTTTAEKLPKLAELCTALFEVVQRSVVLRSVSSIFYIICNNVLKFRISYERELLCVTPEERLKQSKIGFYWAGINLFLYTHLCCPFEPFLIIKIQTQNQVLPV